MSSLRAEHDVPPERVIKRHGTDRKRVLQDILSADLHQVLDAAFERDDLLHQPDVLQWSGGFFDYPGPVPRSDADDTQRAGWRKEYLPSPTQAITAAFCSAVVGYLAHGYPSDSRLRVTFHRTLLIGGEEVLQQCCEYDGVGLDDTPPNAAGRTFEANHATIGAAYVARQVFRTSAEAENETIGEDMRQLRLNDSSRKMAQSVQSIAAIPVIGQTRQTGTGAPTETVIGVLYLDSGQRSYFNDEGRMTRLVTMTGQFATRLSSFASTAAGRIANNAFWRGTATIEPLTLPADPASLPTLEPAPQAPPVAKNVPQINFDFSDFEKVEGWCPPRTNSRVGPGSSIPSSPATAGTSCDATIVTTESATASCFGSSTSCSGYTQAESAQPWSRPSPLTKNRARSPPKDSTRTSASSRSESWHGLKVIFRPP